MMSKWRAFQWWKWNFTRNSFDDKTVKWSKMKPEVDIGQDMSSKYFIFAIYTLPLPAGKHFATSLPSTSHPASPFKTKQCQTVMLWECFPSTGSLPKCVLSVLFLLLHRGDCCHLWAPSTELACRTIAWYQAQRGTRCGVPGGSARGQPAVGGRPLSLARPFGEGRSSSSTICTSLFPCYPWTTGVFSPAINGLVWENLLPLGGSLVPRALFVNLLQSKALFCEEKAIINFHTSTKVVNSRGPLE